MPNLKDPSLLRQQAFIGGAWCDADDGQTIAVTNPANGETVASVPHMGAAETKRAIDAANAAWPAWRKLPAKERAAILRKWNDLMLENADDLALLMTPEQGKPLAEAKGEVRLRRLVHRVVWRRSQARRRRDARFAVAGQTHRRDQGADRRVRRDHAVELPGRDDHPQGRRRRWPPVARSCSSRPNSTPLSALALAVLAERAGVPKGVFSVVTGDSKAIGGEMTAQPARAQADLYRLDRRWAAC